MKTLHRRFAEEAVAFTLRDLAVSEALGTLLECSAQILAQHGIIPGTAAYARYLDLHQRMLPARVRRLHREAREEAH